MKGKIVNGNMVEFQDKGDIKLALIEKKALLNLVKENKKAKYVEFDFIYPDHPLVPLATNLRVLTPRPAVIQSHPLSSQPGGSHVRLEFDNGASQFYTNIKNPRQYVTTVLRNIEKLPKQLSAVYVDKELFYENGLFI